jgi:hypothetical protein
MSIISSTLLRAVIPKFIHKKLLAKAARDVILNYYNTLSVPPTREISEVLKYLKTNPITVFPYDALDRYDPDTVEVYSDRERGLRYVLLDGKRLYFKKKWSKNRIRKTFNGLLREQDPRCPHCYENDTFKVEAGDVVLDIGAAEGNFALSVVEKASRIILFESNLEWVEALNATFGPWKDKVTIVNKFVGGVTNEECTTLDDYIPVGEKVSFLKIDVEGAESQLLKGCKRILQDQIPLKVAICTYHKQQDEQEFNEHLKQNGFETSHSSGYMLVYHDKKFSAPYLRRGLIRAVK